MAAGQHPRCIARGQVHPAQLGIHGQDGTDFVLSGGVAVAAGALADGTGQHQGDAAGLAGLVPQAHGERTDAAGNGHVVYRGGGLEIQFVQMEVAVGRRLPVQVDGEAQIHVHRDIHVERAVQFQANGVHRGPEIHRQVHAGMQAAVEHQLQAGLAHDEAKPGTVGTAQGRNPVALQVGEQAEQGALGRHRGALAHGDGGGESLARDFGDHLESGHVGMPGRSLNGRPGIAALPDGAGAEDHLGAVGEYRAIGQVGVGIQHRDADAIVGRAQGGATHEHQADCMLGLVLLDVVAHAHDLVQAQEVGDRLVEHRQALGQDVVVGLGALVVIGGGNAGLDVADGAGHRIHRIADDAHQGCVKAAHVELRRQISRPIVQGEGLAVHGHVLIQRHAQGVGLDADSAGQGHAGAHGRHRAAAGNGIAGGAVRLLHGQQGQAAVAQLRADLAGTLAHADEGGDIYRLHLDLLLAGHQGLADEEFAGEGRQTGDTHFHVAAQPQVAAGIELGVHGAGQGQDVQAREGDFTPDGTAAGGMAQAVLAQVQGATGILDGKACPGHREAQAHVAGVDGPAIGGLQEIESPGDVGRTQGQAAVHLHVQDLDAFIQGHGGVGGDVQGPGAAGPVHHWRSGGGGRAGAVADGPIDVQGGQGHALGRAGDLVAGNGGAADARLAGEPAPRRGACGHYFGTDDHTQVHVGKQGGKLACTDGGGDVGAPQDQLAHIDVAVLGIRQGHRLAGNGFQEQVPLGMQHAADVGHHVAPHPGLIVEQVQVVAAGGGAHALGEVGAPTVHRDLQMVRRNGQGAAGVEAHIAVRLYRIAAGGDAARGLGFQQDGTIAVRKGGGDRAAQVEATSDVFQANRQIGGGDPIGPRARHYSGGANGQVAVQAHQAADGHVATGNDDFLQLGTVGEAHRACRGSDARGHGDIHRPAQGVDLDGGRGGQAHIAAKAVEGTAAGGGQGIAALPCGVFGQHQGQVHARDVHAGRGIAYKSVRIRRADQQIRRRLFHGAGDPRHQGVQGMTGQGRHHLEFSGVAGHRQHPYAAGDNAGEGVNLGLQGADQGVAGKPGEGHRPVPAGFACEFQTDHIGQLAVRQVQLEGLHWNDVDGVHILAGQGALEGHVPAAAHMGRHGDVASTDGLQGFEGNPHLGCRGIGRQHAGGGAAIGEGQAGAARIGHQGLDFGRGGALHHREVGRGQGDMHEAVHDRNAVAQSRTPESHLPLGHAVGGDVRHRHVAAEGGEAVAVGVRGLQQGRPDEARIPEGNVAGGEGPAAVDEGQGVGGALQEAQVTVHQLHGTGGRIAGGDGLQAVADLARAAAVGAGDAHAPPQTDAGGELDGIALGRQGGGLVEGHGNLARADAGQGFQGLLDLGRLGGGVPQVADGRRGAAAHRQGEGIAAGGGPGRRLHGQVLGRHGAHGALGGQGDPAPVTTGSHVHRRRHGQAGNGLARQCAEELDGKTAAAGPRHADVAHADARQTGQGRLQVGNEHGVGDLHQAIAGEGLGNGGGAAVGEAPVPFEEALAPGGQAGEGQHRVGRDATGLGLAGGTAGTGVRLDRDHLGHHQGGRLLGDGKGAGNTGETGHVHIDIVAGQLQVAAGIEAGRQGTHQGQATDAIDIGIADNGTAAGAICVELQGTYDVLDAHGGAAGLHADVGGGGGDGPVTGGVPGEVEVPPQARRPHDDGAIAHRQVKDIGGFVQRNARAGGNVHQGSGRRRRAPVHHRQAQVAGTQDAVDVQAGAGLHVRQAVAGDGGAAHGGLGGEPTPAGATDFGGNHHADIHIRQAGTGAAAAHGGGNPRAADEELVHVHRGAARQGHALVATALDIQLTVHRQHVGNGRMHLAAQAHLVLDHVQGVAAIGGGHAGAKVGAPLVVGDLQVAGGKGHGAAGADRHIAFRLHCVFAGGDAGRGFVVQEHAAPAIGQGAGDAPQVQAAGHGIETDGNIGDGGAAHHLGSANELQAAGDVHHGTDLDMTGGDGHFLAGNAVGEADLLVRAGDAGLDRDIHGPTQAIDLDDCRRRQGHGAAALEGGRAGGVEGVAGLARGRALGQHQAHIHAGEGQARRAAAHIGIHAMGADQEVGRRLHHGSR